MGIEIEKKFLVNNGSWKTAAEGRRLCQGYIKNDRESVVRIRTAGESAYITVKGKTVNGRRLEYEYGIKKNDAEEMLSYLCPKPLIVKNRYTVVHRGFEWSVDEFLNENKGLVLAEIELDFPEQRFEKPGWLGEEVTEDPKYLNANLVRHPYQAWSPGSHR